jgi:hypothetical protein
VQARGAIALDAIAHQLLAVFKVAGLCDTPGEAGGNEKYEHCFFDRDHDCSLCLNEPMKNQRYKLKILALNKYL